MLLIRTKDAYKNCACENKKNDEAFSVERLTDLRRPRDEVPNSTKKTQTNGFIAAAPELNPPNRNWQESAAKLN